MKSQNNLEKIYQAAELLSQVCLSEEIYTPANKEANTGPSYRLYSLRVGYGYINAHNLTMHNGEIVISGIFFDHWPLIKGFLDEAQAAGALKYKSTGFEKSTHSYSKVKITHVDLGKLQSFVIKANAKFDGVNTPHYNLVSQAEQLVKKLFPDCNNQEIMQVVCNALNEELAGFLEKPLLASEAEHGNKVWFCNLVEGALASALQLKYPEVQDKVGHFLSNLQLSQSKLLKNHPIMQCGVDDIAPKSEPAPPQYRHIEIIEKKAQQSFAITTGMVVQFEFRDTMTKDGKEEALMGVINDDEFSERRSSFATVRLPSSKDCGDNAIWFTITDPNALELAAREALRKPLLEKATQVTGRLLARVR